MARTLVIGYGNRDRGDDGVAFEVINALRSRLGQEPLQDEQVGLERAGSQVDSLFVMQLAPEWLDVAAGYERLIFVDAHAVPEAPDVQCTRVEAEFRAAAFTHHMTPAMFLALLQAMHRQTPTGWMLSVRGADFSFRRGLSDSTAARVLSAVECIEGLLEDDAES